MVTLQDENSNTTYSIPNEFLHAPNDQVIREMQHHIHYKEHDGVFGHHVPSTPLCNPTQSTPPNTSFSNIPTPFSQAQQISPQHPMIISPPSTPVSKSSSTPLSTPPSGMTSTLTSPSPSTPQSSVQSTVSPAMPPPGPSTMQFPIHFTGSFAP